MQSYTLFCRDALTNLTAVGAQNGFRIKPASFMLTTYLDTITDLPSVKDLAGFVARAQFESLPDPVIDHALLTFVNFIGCAAAGSTHEALAAAAHALGSGGHSRVIGRDAGYAPAVAALLNGIAGAVNAFDDTHSEAMVHPGTPVGAALVALASASDRPVSGRDFLTAYAWGIEIACRLSKAISVAPAVSDLGWSQTGIAASVGVSAACARLLGLPERETIWALGTAATQASGLRAAHGSMAMHLAPARAAACGLEAACLAQAGFTGPEHGIDGKMGFFSLFAQHANPASLFANLGTHFELQSITFKPYPCGIVIHAVIDACIALSMTPGLVTGAIAELILEVPVVAATLADDPHPAGVFAAQVSLQHWAAAALLRGTAGLAEGTAQAISDPDIAAVRGRCKVVVRGTLASDAAVVRLRFVDGRRREVAISHCTGSLANPMTRDGIAAKFLSQATLALGVDETRRLHDASWHVPLTEDVRFIWTGGTSDNCAASRTER